MSNLPLMPVGNTEASPHSMQCIISAIAQSTDVLVRVAMSQEANGHWFSDMVAGGILGYWLGAGILEKTRIEKKMASGLSVTVAPLYKGICLNVVKKL